MAITTPSGVSLHSNGNASVTAELVASLRRRESTLHPTAFCSSLPGPLTKRRSFHWTCTRTPLRIYLSPDQNDTQDILRRQRESVWTVPRRPSNIDAVHHRTRAHVVPMPSLPCGARPAVRILFEQLETNQHHRCEKLLIGDNTSAIFME